MDQAQIEARLKTLISDSLNEVLRELSSSAPWAGCVACAKFRDALSTAHNFGFRVNVRGTEVSLINDCGEVPSLQKKVTVITAKSRQDQAS
jgi:hypothetical protein